MKLKYHYSDTPKQRALVKIAAQLASKKNKRWFANELFEMIYFPDVPSDDEKQFRFNKAIDMYLKEFRKMDTMPESTMRKNWEQEVDTAIKGGADLNQIAKAMELRNAYPKFRNLLNPVVHSGDLMNEEAENPLQDIYLHSDPEVDNIFTRVIGNATKRQRGPWMTTTRSRRRTPLPSTSAEH